MRWCTQGVPTVRVTHCRLVGTRMLYLVSDGILFETGDTTSGVSGDTRFTTGSAAGGPSGSISVLTGSRASANSNAGISLSAGMFPLWVTPLVLCSH